MRLNPVRTVSINRLALPHHHFRSSVAIRKYTIKHVKSASASTAGPAATVGFRLSRTNRRGTTAPMSAAMVMATVMAIRTVAVNHQSRCHTAATRATSPAHRIANRAATCDSFTTESSRTRASQPPTDHARRSKATATACIPTLSLNASVTGMNNARAAILCIRCSCEPATNAAINPPTTFHSSERKRL